MKETNDISCSKCHIKVEPVFSYGWGHEAIYNETCQCGHKFIVEKFVYSDDYFGVIYSDKYIIHETNTKTLNKVNIVDYANKAHLLFNKENPNYKKLINNVNKYIAE